MTDRTRLAERLEERAQMCCPYVDQNAPDQEAASRAARNNADLIAMLREAAEWLRRDEALESEVQHWRSQRCETCQHGEPWPVVAGCLYCRHVQDHCDVMGNGCNAWEARP